MRPFRILSIDGGGMKGVYAASYLQTVEDRLAGRLCDHFDLVVGTSTGGIIALGIGANKSASEILGFYRDCGPRIFPRALGNGALVMKSLAMGSAHKQAVLRDCLQKTFSHADGSALLMKDSCVRLCIPAVYATSCGPRVFKSVLPGDSTTERYIRDPEIPMWQVALATSAAPLYYPLVTVNEGQSKHQYVDGGLWANNPSLVGISEALQNYCGEGRSFQGITLLSIALPGSGGYGHHQKDPKGVGLVARLLSYTMESGKGSAHFMASYMLCGKDDAYFRNEPRQLSTEQDRYIKLDGASTRAIEDLVSAGHKDAVTDWSKPTLKAIFT